MTKPHCNWSVPVPVSSSTPTNRRRERDLKQHEKELEATLWNSNRGDPMSCQLNGFRYKRGRWADQFFHPAYPGKHPLAIIWKRPRAVRAPQRPQKRTEKLGYVILRAAVDYYRSENPKLSERAALNIAMVELEWEPSTHEEMERLHREIRRL
jgi:hypothetical protein